MVRRLVIACCLAIAGAGLAAADKSDQFFDDTKVQEIRLYFTDSNWYNTLYQAHANDASDPYFPVTFKYGDTVLDNVGVRFKGNASFRRSQSVKKSFKFDFNVYNEDTTFLGLKKLNLNNGDLQPTFLPEKMFLDFASKYIAAMRAVYCRLYVNDVYYGLYIAVEQPDKTMMENRFGGTEDGNLYEAGESNATLSYLGTSAASYQKLYELKTNEDINDYSGLIEFLDVLNNTASSSLPAKLEPICDVENMLYGIALNILFVNLDSYAGSASEFYLYDRSDTGQFIHIHWDLNESFGTTGDGSPKITTPAKLDPFYLPTSSSTGGAMGGSTGRPLMSKLWAVDSYKRTYLRMLARMLRDGFNTTAMTTRATELANLIRSDVYADNNKLYTNAQFESGLNSSVSSGQVTLLGVLQFVKDRYAYLRPVLDTYAQPADMRINELMTVNTSTIKDEAGDYDPWLELHNLGPGTLNLSGYYLTDDTNNPTKWALPSQSVADGGFVVVWLDGETGEGTNHASFTPNSAGGTLYLYYGSGTSRQLIDSVTYGKLTAGQSLARMGSLNTQWVTTTNTTAGADNPTTITTSTTGTGQLLITEVMADNKSTLTDPDEAGAYEDWFEIYNPGTTAVDMSGMYISENPLNPTKWQVPQGVTIPAGGYLVFWADNDTSQGSLHTNFNLDADGEVLQLFAKDGTTLIDSVAFKTQQPDISYGRNPSDSSKWSIFKPATPGAKNASPFCDWVVNAASFQPGPLAPLAIASAFGTNLATTLASAQAAPLPTTLSGTVVNVTDSAKVTRAAGLFFVSPTQVNFQVPAGTAAGRATVSIVRQDGTSVSGEVLVETVAPGTFSANATGEGVGLVAALRVDASGKQTAVPVYSYDSTTQTIVATPIDLGASTDSVYLVIYGTGIRNGSGISAASADVGGKDVPVLYAAAQSEYVGLDQVNIGPLPAKLAGKGDVAVVIKMDGKRTNTVTVNIK